MVENAVINKTAGAGAAIIACYGLEAMANPANKEKIREIFKSARNQALQEMGVLDESLQVIPGQEAFLS